MTLIKKTWIYRVYSDDPRNMGFMHTYYELTNQIHILGFVNSFNKSNKRHVYKNEPSSKIDPDEHIMWTIIIDRISGFWEVKLNPDALNVVDVDLQNIIKGKRPVAVRIKNGELLNHPDADIVIVFYDNRWIQYNKNNNWFVIVNNLITP